MLSNVVFNAYKFVVGQDPPLQQQPQSVDVELPIHYAPEFVASLPLALKLAVIKEHFNLHRKGPSLVEVLAKESGRIQCPNCKCLVKFTIHKYCLRCIREGEEGVELLESLRDNLKEAEPIEEGCNEKSQT